MNSKIASLAAAAGLICAALPCQSALAARPGFYVGGSITQLSRNADKADFDRYAHDVYDAVGLASISVGHSTIDDGGSTSFGFVAGYRFLKHFAAEVEYLDLGKIRYHAADVVAFPGDVFPVDTVIERKTTGLGISALGIWPLSDRWEAYARGGVLLSSDHLEFTLVDDAGGGLFGNDNSSGAAMMAGAGISLTFANMYSVRAEFRRVFDAGGSDMPGKGDVDLVSVGILVQF